MATSQYSNKSGRPPTVIKHNCGRLAVAYKASCLRAKKTVNGVKSEYIWDGTQLAGQKNGTGTMMFLYEGTGLSGFQKDGVNYYYLRNGQNDIIGILDSSGNRVVSYTYDAWGKLLTTTGSMASTLGAQTPFRYRGYYYDSESGLYYLQSRYYDPNTGRFLNADDTDILLEDQGNLIEHNLFAYSLNNPVNFSDPSGEIALVDDAAYVILGILAVGTIALAYVITTPEAQRGWAGLGQAIDDTFTSIGNGISNAWNNAKSALSTWNTSVEASKVLEKSVSKTQTKIRNEKNRYDYWIASYVDYENGIGTYVPTTPLSYSRATSYVRAGGSVFANSKSSAYRLALSVGYGRAPKRAEIHSTRDGSSLGYWWHYHDGLREGGHIFYA